MKILEKHTTSSSISFVGKGMIVSVIGSDFFPKNFAAFSTKRIGRLLDSFFPPQFGLIFEVYGQNCLNFNIIRLKNPRDREVTMPNK